MASFKEYCKTIFWNYKRMDNVVYNFDVLTSLIKAADKSKKPQLFYKPIIVMMMAIIECTLFDFLKRAQSIRYEKINLTKAEKSLIRKQKIPDRLKCYVDICKKHSFLGVKEKGYKTLYEFIDIRNRVHIQNIKQRGALDELDLWDAVKVKTCGNLLKAVFKHLCLNYPRENIPCQDSDFEQFPAPWERL